MSTYLGDYSDGATVHFLWDTTSAAGASITRATDGTISVYKDNGATQTTEGITNDEDFDSLTGVHSCTIDLSAGGSPNFYVTGSDYAVVLSGATIDGQAVNAVIAHFSIENRSASAGGSAPTASDVADAVWDEVMSGHVTAGTFGQRLQAIRTGTAQAGTSSTIQLDASASSTDDLYNGALIVLTGGTGAGQANAIIDYVGSTTTATVAHTWVTNPSSDTTFVVLPQAPEALFAWGLGSLVEASHAVKSLYTAVAGAVNKTDENSGNKRTYRSDGTTVHATQAITTDAAANPIAGLGGGS